MTRHKAFTMLELVFVIVVLGILAAIAIPRLDRDRRQEAIDNVLAAVRYTQHLALLDDKHTFNDDYWQQKFWMIRFNTGANAFYTVSSDTDESGTITKTEAAVDPANGKYMYNSNGLFAAKASDESPNIFLGHNYGIDTITTAGGCSGYKHVAFDNMGRPHVGLATSAGTIAGNLFATYMTQDCNITFSFADSTSPFTLTIKQETGYAYVIGQPDS